MNDLPEKQQRFSETDQRRAMVARLWLDLDAAYGRLFDNGGGVDSAKFKIWMDGLSAVPIENLRRGILRFRKEWSGEFPPSMPAFRGLCTTAANYHHPQNCSDQDKAQTEATARKLLGNQFGNGERRVITRGPISVFQKKRNGHWFDQYPTGLTKYNLDDIYGDNLSLINTALPRNDDDSPVAGAAA